MPAVIPSWWTTTDKGWINTIWDDGFYYWALEGVDDDYSISSANVFVDDADNNALVGWFGADYWVLRWDANDTFLDNGGASSQAAFEAAFEDDGFTVAYEATSGDVSVWNLMP